MKQWIQNNKGNSVIEIIVLLAIVPVIFLAMRMVWTTDISNETEEPEQVNPPETIDQDVLLLMDEVLEVFVVVGALSFGVALLVGALHLTTILMDNREEKEKQKNMIDLMKDLTKKGVASSFRLEQKEQEKSVFLYEKNEYVFTVTKKAETISCKVTKEGKSRTLFYFVYQLDSRTFLARNIAKGQFQDEKADTQILETFIEQVIQGEWVTAVGWNVLQEEQVEKTYLPFVPTHGLEENDLQSEMRTFMAQVSSLGESTLTGRLERIARVLGDLIPYLETMDVEVNHIVHESLLTDLQKLMELYAVLEEADKEMYLAQVTSGMEKIENKMEVALHQAKDKKERDIAKMLLVIEKRYNEQQV